MDSVPVLACWMPIFLRKCAHFQATERTTRSPSAFSFFEVFLASTQQMLSRPNPNKATKYHCDLTLPSTPKPSMSCSSLKHVRQESISLPSQNCRIVQSFTVHHLDQDSGPAAHIPIHPIHPIPPTSFTSAWPTGGVMCIKVHCWDIVLAKVFRSKITFGPI